MLQPYEFDFRNFSKDKNMKKHFKDEIIYYSDTIKKTNDKGKVQDRNIIITDKAIYNFKDTTFRRRIPLDSLIAITVSSSFAAFCKLLSLTSEITTLYPSVLNFLA